MHLQFSVDGVDLPFSHSRQAIFPILSYLSLNALSPWKRSNISSTCKGVGRVRLWFSEARSALTRVPLAIRPISRSSMTCNSCGSSWKLSFASVNAMRVCFPRPACHRRSPQDPPMAVTKSPPFLKCLEIPLIFFSNLHPLLM